MTRGLDVLICEGGACISSHSLDIEEELKKQIEKYSIKDKVRIVKTGCMGPCQYGPLMLVYPEGILYKELTIADIKEIVEEHFLKGRVVEKFLFKSEITGEIIREKENLPFFQKQLKIVLKNCGTIDPENIEEYINNGGYEALRKVLTELSPSQAIQEIKDSELRGRGGAGFPTGVKWEFVFEAKSSEKFIICNADEGDPGAFMDRAVLEGDPHTVIEGMSIAAYVVGANRGYVYVRAEYPLAIKRLEIALQQAREYNFLGKDILESGFNFNIELRIGAGAFVCGEETALIASIEGKRGMPRSRPPFPATCGLWGKPTLINNVETLANIRHIVLKGAKWFSSIGINKNKGTKVFALSGKIKNTGLVEVPLGITIGELIFDIGGGIPDGKKFKAVQTGGPSGGCIPREYLNTPITYESLKDLGSIMGSGGVIVLDEDTCVVDLTRFFIEFTASESCGKCVPCRIGLKQMLGILDKITEGKAVIEDLDLLEYLAKSIAKTALCGLGQTAPNPVLSTLKYFRDEYEAHILEKRCPAAVCAALFISPCQTSCPVEVDVSSYVTHIANGDFEKAFYVHMQKNPLPGVCGRVCYAFCENKCRRAQTDESIAIADLKRFIADYAVKKGINIPPPENPKKEKIAIIGSGPAGLSCAFHLTRLGYLPVVYEALSIAGGMMATAIPEYRLPRQVLRDDIERIEKAGVQIKLSQPVEDLNVLLEAGYKAIFIAAGTPRGQKLELEGRDLERVTTGVEFLKSISLSGFKKIEGDVVVIGGGNSAVDSARSSLRLGAKSVSIVYRRTKADMPAIAEEIEAAREEGVNILEMSMPVKIIGNKCVEEIECVKMRSTEFDSSGRRRFVPLENSEFLLKANTVIISIGQRPKLEFLKKSKVKLNKGGFVEIDPLTMATSREGVFAGGDVIGGSANVVQAIAGGRKAAIAIDKYLGGRGVIVDEKRKVVETNYDEKEYLEEKPRQVPSVLSSDERKMSFREVKSGFTPEQAIEEARRCLHCDREEIE